MAFLNGPASVWNTIWSALGYVWDQLYYLAQKIGLGGGVGIVAFLRYMKPPGVNTSWVLRALFDAISHVVSNGRSGERTAEDGRTIIWIPPARRQDTKPEPSAGTPEPVSTLIQSRD